MTILNDIKEKCSEKAEGHRGGACLKISKGLSFNLLFLPLTLIYLELILKITDKLDMGALYIISASVFAVAFGAFLDMFTLLPKSVKGGRIVTGIIAELMTCIFLMMHYIYVYFTVYMDPDAIFAEAGDVAGGFGNEVIMVVWSGAHMILLYHIPVFVYLAFNLIRKQKSIFRPERNLKLIAVMLIAAIVLGTLASLLQLTNEVDRSKCREEYTFDSAVQTFGVLSAVRLYTGIKLFGENIDTPVIDPDPEPVLPKYELNSMNIDFEGLAAAAKDENLKALYTYMSVQTPSSKNEYTGMFKGKNLILICAEAFSKEAIDPEFTPTLYRLATKGIVFEDYYQPAWGGSTSTGEYSMLTGLIPTSGVQSIQTTVKKNMYFTIGNQLRRENYFSAGYHDGTYGYYHRNKTHPNLGYDSWMGMGNGMEKGVENHWPQSDNEMMKFTVPKYIDKQPFSIYYMTVSGHANYLFSGNSMASRNKKAANELDASKAIRGYMATQKEFEKGMASLVASLEEAGIADDTVIVITADHYPYGLTNGKYWDTPDVNYLYELYGLKQGKSMSQPVRDHNALIIWSGCLEEREEPIVVSEPTYSLDILPTISNLFGVEYDSRLFAGRDALSEEEAIVIWNNHDWMTSAGYYKSSKGKFVPNEGVEFAEGEQDIYVERIKSKVNMKFALSKQAISCDLYEKILKGLIIEENVSETGTTDEANEQNAA